MKKPFIPHDIPIKELDWIRLVPLIGQANSALSNYNGIIRHMINPLLLLKPLTMQEAVLSSKIEGTQASLTEVLQKNLISKYDERKKLDVEEIENYTKALHYGINDLQKRPLCLNMIKDIHRILLEGSRGENKARGEFRRIQNYIGAYGAKIENATFIPPSVNHMIDALDKWEKYIHSENDDILLQLSVIHAQFEIIHPFLDGNGRVGRILIPLFLYAKKYLAHPVFYLSEFLEDHRWEYYERLRAISEKDDWQGWIEFFLTAIIKQSELNLNRTLSILQLYDKTKHKISEVIQSKYILKVIDLLFEKPILISSYLAEKAFMPDNSTAIRILDKLVDAKVLEKAYAGSGRKAGSYMFAELLNLIEGAGEN